MPAGSVAIAAGQFHTCAVTSGGGVKCWGLNANGQLGDNSVTQRLDAGQRQRDRQRRDGGGGGECATPARWSAAASSAGASTPTASSATARRRSSLDAGRRHRPDQRRDGDRGGLFAHLRATHRSGDASAGATISTAQLGDGTLVATGSTPVDVIGLTSGVTAIAAGRQHTCALTSGGAVNCWGDDSLGQLGDNGNAHALDARRSSSGQPVVKAMSAGGSHTCAIVGNGGVKCWGANDNGQLGDNSIVAAVDRRSTSAGSRAASSRSPRARATPAR